MHQRYLLFALILLGFASIFSAPAAAQELSLNHYYSFDPVFADEGPKLNGGVGVDYPEEARKNGVEGTLKASLILGEDGKVRDIKILQTLPFGVEQAVIKGLQNLVFQPARLNGKPVPVKMYFSFIVAAVYDENDKNVTKPKITDKPAPAYPSKYAAEKLKGKVQVLVQFNTDGTVKVLGLSSVLPREFDVAAREAVANLRFEPAVHKKSKAKVSQKMTVEYEFKP